MPKITRLLFFLFASFRLTAQDVQWASRVIDFSTQLTDYAYAATQALGKPNVLPDGGDNPNAWMPSRPDRISEIKVGFDAPVRVQQIAVAESFHPGALYRIYLYDTQDKEYLLATFNPHPVSSPSRSMNIYIKETEYSVSAVKVVLDCEAVEGYNAIDAIGISGSREPIKVTANLAFRKNPSRDNESVTFDEATDASDSRPFKVPGMDLLYFTRSQHAGNAGGVDDPEDIWHATIDPETGDPAISGNQGTVMNNEGPNTLGSIGILDGKLSMLIGNAAGKNGKIQAGLYYEDQERPDRFMGC
jgi:hypothetical protein